MKKKGLPLFLVILTLGFLLLFWQREALLLGLAEGILNASSRECFQGSIRLRKVSFEPGLRLRLEGFKGSLESESGRIPVEIGRVEARESLVRLFSAEGLIFDFKQARPATSSGQGLDGTLQLRAGRKWYSRLEADIHSLDLGDLSWMNPEYLTGAKGPLRGKVAMTADYREQSTFQGWVVVDKPGGLVGGHLFDAVLPYLPQMPDKARVKAFSSKAALVGYRDARLEMDMAGSDRIKLFFHILVPDYNFNLNLHAEVRTDQKNGFYQLIEIMGLLKAK